MNPKNAATWRKRDDFIKVVLASTKLSDKAARVLARLAMFLFVEEGRIDPSCKTLARASRVSERTVYRILEQAEADGWIEVDRSKGRHKNQYVLSNTAIHMAALNTATQMAVLGDPTLPNRVPNTAKSGSQHCHTLAVHKQRKDRTTKRTTKKESDSAPDFNFAESKKEAAAQTETSANSTPSARRPKTNKGDGAGDAEVEAAFERFWSVYPKRVAKEAARKAFAAVIKRGADPEAVIARAQRYAVERKDQDPKYTPYPARWLNEGRYNDPLPGAPVIDNETGSVSYEQSPPRRDSREKTHVELAHELVARIGNVIIN